MNRDCIVIPVKNPDRAKERLAGVLAAEQRRTLALVLFQGVLETLSAASLAADVLVVTDDERVEAMARTAGTSVLREERAEGETAAVERATRWTVERGYRRQVVIPGDMAELDPADLRRLLARDVPPPSVVLAPAVGDDGTNAIMTSPPDALRFRFGSRSFPDYVEQARQRNVRCEILRLDSLVLDVDTPDDLFAFLRKNPRSPGARLVEAWEIGKTLRPAVTHRE